MYSIGTGTGKLTSAATVPSGSTAGGSLAVATSY
jgi:hypothetical protein